MIVDSTVMERAVAHPTDSRLLERCREHEVKAAARHGLTLRQRDNRVAPRLVTQIGGYARVTATGNVRDTINGAKIGGHALDDFNVYPAFLDHCRGAS